MIKEYVKCKVFIPLMNLHGPLGTRKMKTPQVNILQLLGCIIRGLIRGSRNQVHH